MFGKEPYEESEVMAALRHVSFGDVAVDIILLYYIFIFVYCIFFFLIIIDCYVL